MANSAASSSIKHLHHGARPGRNPWRLLTIPFCVLGVAGVWFGIAWFFRAYRGLHIPPDAFLFSGTRIGNILMNVPPLFPSFFVGFLIGNFLHWCVPPARATLELESAEGKQLIFRANQLTFAQLGGIVVAVTLPVCFLGANNFWAAAPNRIDYRPLFSLATRQYAWSNVKEIDTACYSGKGNVTYRFAIQLSDGRGIDLMEESPRDFANTYPQIQTALRGHAYKFINWKFTGPCAAHAPSRLREILLQRPTE